MTTITQLTLPWFGNHDDRLYLSSMSLTDPEGEVSRRKAYRLVRKWYREQVGITVCKKTLERVWKNRFTTTAMTEGSINQQLHDMARETYEKTKDESDIDAQEEAGAGAEL